jgi:hypothetical protein
VPPLITETVIAEPRRDIGLAVPPIPRRFRRTAVHALQVAAPDSRLAPDLELGRAVFLVLALV